jgi:tRNA dimethylallyltransferase
MGPTASGKTSCAIALLKHLPCEIVSVDSAMIYRDMNIGTAKPSDEILQQAPHHLIDIRNPDQTYSVAEFCQDANQLISEIQARQRIPLLVGGTIMYFHSLQFGLSELPAANQQVRTYLEQAAAISGWESLYQKLQEIDPVSAAKIHPNDPQRLQRALEVYVLTGITLSDWHAHKKTEARDTNILNIGLFPEDRAKLHADIAVRYYQMLAEGFIEEVIKLRADWSLTSSMPSMRCIGYRQAWSYLEGHITQNEMYDQATAATRQLAKRQLTWLRHYPDVQLIDTGEVSVEGVVEQIISHFQ